MKRQSDIGWFELIMGLILIIIDMWGYMQQVGVCTWMVGALSVGVIDIVSGCGGRCWLSVSGVMGTISFGGPFCNIRCWICKL